jgi:hypothetical protein
MLVPATDGANPTHSLQWCAAKDTKPRPLDLTLEETPDAVVKVLPSLSSKMAFSYW